MSQGDTAYWLIWPTLGGAVVLATAAFLLWGLNGASTLFEMVMAWCT